MAAGLCLFLFIALPAMAQQGQQQGQPGDAGSQKQISDAELEKAAQAYSQIMMINHEFQQSLKEDQDATERQKLQAAANKRMVKAVEDTGLDVTTYNNIMVQVRANEALSKKFTEKMQKVR
jgi:hypothetical protein